MICEKVYFPYKDDTSVHLTCYLHAESPEMPKAPRDAILVIPGGGYTACSDREAEPIALAYMQYGLNAFVLRYSTKKKSAFPRPLNEASLSVKFIKDNAERFHINPDRVFAVGFSAGGHLCASLGTFHSMPSLLKELNMEKGENRVRGTILSYPVISTGEFTHIETMTNLLGTSTPTDEERELYSVEKHVSPETAPAFIWHTYEDTCVPVENSLMLAAAMRRNNVPFELHIFKKGIHGLSLCNEITASTNGRFIEHDNEGWLEMSVKWMKDQ